MFTVDRVFSLKNHKTGMTDWYFQAREGNVGPYQSKQQAEAMLKEFIQTCIRLGHTGGRGGENQQAQIAIQNYLNYGAKGQIQWV